jgi:aspartate racemase
MPGSIPGLIISNVSFPKILEEEISSNKESPALMIPYLYESIKRLEDAGIDFIVLPCNTLHSILPELRERSSKKFVDLIEVVSDKVKKLGIKKVGILGTTKTRSEKLYDTALGEVETLYPSHIEQERLSGIIIKIIRCESTKADKKFIDNLVNGLLRRGAEKVILACTDLANIAGENECIIDSTETLIDFIKKEMNKD